MKTKDFLTVDNQSSLEPFMQVFKYFLYFSETELEIFIEKSKN